MLGWLFALGSKVKDWAGGTYKAASHIADEKLRAENKALKEQILDRQNARHDEATGYVYFDGDLKPYCPKCFYDREKKIPLRPTKFSQQLRTCVACDFSHVENPTPISHRPKRYRRVQLW